MIKVLGSIRTKLLNTGKHCHFLHARCALLLQRRNEIFKAMLYYLPFIFLCAHCALLLQMRNEMFKAIFITSFHLFTCTLCSFVTEAQRNV